MDFFDILIPIVVIFGSIISKSLQDKEKIKKERLEKMQNINDEPNSENYISEERVETKMKSKNQNIYQNEKYEEDQVYNDFVKNNNYVLNEIKNIDESTNKRQHNLNNNTVSKSTSNSYFLFTKNDIVRGIIMSELLGKPKSLNKHK